GRSASQARSRSLPTARPCRWRWTRRFTLRVRARCSCEPVPASPLCGHARTVHRSSTAGSTDQVTHPPVLSVVMPAYNEAEYLENSVRELHDGLTARGLDFELLIVENGSTDGTPELAQRLASHYSGVRVLTCAVANYGAALREGLTAARGELVITFD